MRTRVGWLLRESTAISRPGETIRPSDLPESVHMGREPGRVAFRPGAGVTLKEVERDLIRRTLLRHGGNRTHAARVLRIGVRTLQRKIGEYGLRIPYRPGRRRPARHPQRSTQTPSPAPSAAGRM